MRYALLGLLLLVRCHAEDDLNLSNTVAVGRFTIDIPVGWKVIEAVGYDSYVGRIVGPLATIHYDQGFFSAGLDRLSENDGTIYFERITINENAAVLHKEKTLIGNNADGMVILTAYIEGENGLRNRLYIQDPSVLQEKIFLDVIMTHQFK
ncbi:MAG TPA: hypothetical protein VFT90_12705 [Chryseosolibacter sp.]|nr:hypothetical protein [Chryseosolibacter sp.]